MSDDVGFRHAAAVLLTCVVACVCADITAEVVSDAEWTRLMSGVGRSGLVDGAVPLERLPTRFHTTLSLRGTPPLPLCSRDDALHHADGAGCDFRVPFAASDDLLHLSIALRVVEALATLQTPSAAERAHTLLASLMQGTAAQRLPGPVVTRLPPLPLSMSEAAHVLGFAADDLVAGARVAADAGIPTMRLDDGSAFTAAVMDTLRAVKTLLRQTFVLFGATQQLRLQYAQVGLETGVPLVSLRRDVIGGELQESGGWETVQTALLQALLRPGDVAADIGAHIGTQTVALSRAVGSLGTVHAFEVTPSVYDVLRANAAVAGVGNIVTHRVAVGHTRRTVALLRRRGLHTVYSGLPAETAVGPDAPLSSWDDADDASRLDAELSPADADAHVALRLPVLNVLGPEHADGAASESTRERGADLIAVSDPSSGVVLPSDAASRRGTANFGGFSVVSSVEAVTLPQLNERFDVVPLVDVDAMAWHTRGPCPALIKIDVEGLEVAVLEGANATLRCVR
jgi:FkbM family methyltransferase